MTLGHTHSDGPLPSIENSALPLSFHVPASLNGSSLAQVHLHVEFVHLSLSSLSQLEWEEERKEVKQREPKHSGRNMRGSKHLQSICC